jgi:ACT domain-containing protein
MVMMMNKERLIITILGADKPGIVAGVSQVLAEHTVNIEDISQTILQEYFAMIMIVDITHSTIPLKELKEQLDKTAEEIGVKILAHHENLFRSMHRI